MACMSSFEASPACTLLMIASSAARCSVSFSSRCVSSKWRAFSSAMAIPEATVESRRRSPSPKASTRSWFSTMMAPIMRSPANIGVKTAALLRSVPGI